MYSTFARVPCARQSRLAVLAAAPTGTAPGSPFLNQYDPAAARWVRDPNRLPNTDLTNTFTPE